MLKLALIKANKVNGNYTKPDVSKITSANDLAAIADDKTPKSVTIPDIYPGEQIADGEYYAANFDTNANKVVGNLVSIQGVKIAGDPTPTGVKTNANGSVSEN